MDLQQYQSAKLVLLGDMGAGKSSLVLRYVKGTYFDDLVGELRSPDDIGCSRHEAERFHHAFHRPAMRHWEIAHLCFVGEHALVVEA
eukprot:1140700-Pelagomonas_calceolata.AAC.2